jgi:hypothetical protein
MTNVLDVYINHLRRKADSGYDGALIRTMGHQIGGNGRRHWAPRYSAWQRFEFNSINRDCF